MHHTAIHCTFVYVSDYTILHSYTIQKKLSLRDACIPFTTVFCRFISSTKYRQIKHLTTTVKTP